MNLQIYQLTKEDALKIINEKHALSEQKPEDLFIFGGRLSSQSLDSHNSRMTSQSIKNYADDANKGFPLITMHDKKPYSIGRVFMGEISGVETNRSGLDVTGLNLDILAYIPLNLQVADNLNTNDFIRGIESGTWNQLSIGFDCDEHNDLLCSVCNKNILSCNHSPGKRYNGNRAYYWVNNAHAKEASLVSIGSNPDTKIFKTIRERENKLELEVLKTRLVAINPEFGDRINDIQADDDTIFERVIDLLGDTQKKIAELEVEKTRLNEKAQMADEFFNGLIDEAIKQRVRANGQGNFDDEKYRGVLVKLNDVAYVRSEIERWSDLAEKVFQKETPNPNEADKVKEKDSKKSTRFNSNRSYIG